MKYVKKLVITIFSLLFILSLVQFTDQQATASTITWKNTEEILAHIKDPVFPEYTVNIIDFGAVADGKTLCSEAFAKAIADVSAKGGGTVSIPKGTYITGSIQLLDNVNLHLEDMESVIKFTKEINEKNYPIVYSHWEASPCYNYRALIYAIDAQNIAVSGQGCLDGQADEDTWWPWKTGANGSGVMQDSARNQLMKMNNDRVPIENRVFGDGSYLRPNFIQFIRCENVLLDGVRIINSPMWEINPVFCTNVTVRRVHINTKGYNNDGCDPESSNYVLIENCYFDTGDDCIAIKSGRDADGRFFNKASENIIIRNNIFAEGHGGIAIGSEMSGSVRNVFADNNKFDSPDLTYAVRFKTNAKRGGIIENIYLRNSVIKTVDQAVIHATMLYEEGRSGQFLPQFKNIVIENLTSSGGEYGVFIETFPEVPLEGLVLKNVDISNVQTPIRAMNWEAPVLSNVMINGLSFPRPTETRLLGLPMPGHIIRASSLFLGGDEKDIVYEWKVSNAKTGNYSTLAIGQEYKVLNKDAGKYLKLVATDKNGNISESITYKVVSGTSFNDISSRHYAWSTIERLVSKGIIEANGQRFNPNKAITRLEVAKMLAKIWNLDMPKKAVLIKDIALDSENYAVVAAVVEREMMNLKGDSFDPTGIITKEEMADIAMNSCGVSYKNASNATPLYSDAQDIDTIYHTNVARAAYFGFFGDVTGKFNPKDKLTNEQAAFVLVRISDFAGK